VCSYLKYVQQNKHHKIGYRKSSTEYLCHQPFNALASNTKPATIFVEHVCTIKITQEFSRLGLPLFVIFILEPANLQAMTLMALCRKTLDTPPLKPSGYFMYHVLLRSTLVGKTLKCVNLQAASKVDSNRYHKRCMNAASSGNGMYHWTNIKKSCTRPRTIASRPTDLLPLTF
jgi:hypothetical protein